MCRLICINDANRPKEIPKKKWITRDQEYTCIWITIHPDQGNIQGVMLAEITLDETCAPYETYKLSRFGIHVDDLEDFIALAKECSGFNSDTIKEIIEQENLVMV
jgi:hypothetical protein